MATLPYVTSAGNIEKALEGIKAAQVPELVTQDFVKTVLKIKGGSGNQITSFLKKIGFAGADGRPTELYRKFRNPTTSSRAIAKAIRQAYAPLYVRNEYMHELNDDELIGLIVEVTGAAHDSNPVKMTFNSLKSLKNYADFEQSEGADEALHVSHEANEELPRLAHRPTEKAVRSSEQMGFNLGYTINLNLPPTSDPAVFNAIFKSLKEHLLKVDDA